MLKQIIPILAATVYIQLPAFAYTDFKEPGKVILFGFPPKTKFTITYGDLKFFRSAKLRPDKCGTVIVKIANRTTGYFQDAEDYIIEGDDKTSIIAKLKQTDLLAQRESIDWDSVESARYRYSCLNGVINPQMNSFWLERNGVKFFLSGRRESPTQKLYITGIPYSTIKLKTLQEVGAKQVTRNVSSDKCGAITIRDNPKYLNSLLGEFRINIKGSWENWVYNFATIPEVLDRDPIVCDGYKR